MLIHVQVLGTKGPVESSACKNAFVDYYWVTEWQMSHFDRKIH